jgi:hypothetical protein
MLCLVFVDHVEKCSFQKLRELLSESDPTYRNDTEHNNTWGVWSRMNLVTMDKSRVGATDAKNCIKNWGSEAGRSSPISALASGEPPKQRGCGDRSVHPQILEIAHVIQRYDRP